MTLPFAPNVICDIYRGFNPATVYPAAQASKAAAGVPGYLIHHVKNGIRGKAANGLYWTHVLFLDVSTDIRDASNSQLNVTSPTQADTVLIGAYPTGPY